MILHVENLKHSQELFKPINTVKEVDIPRLVIFLDLNNEHMNDKIK